MHTHPIEFVDDQRPDPLLAPGFDVIAVINALFLVGCLVWLWPSDPLLEAQLGDVIAGWSML